MSADVECARSLDLGAKALTFIKAHSIAATPRNYGVWYAYASGQDERIAAVLDQVLSTQSPISQKIIDKLFEDFIAPSRPGDRIEGISDQLSRRVGAIASTLDAASTLSEEFGGALSSAAIQLASNPSVPALQILLEELARSSLAAERENRAMRQSLHLSLEELKTIKANISAVQSEASIDTLTGLFNRRHFNTIIGPLTKAVQNSGAPLSLLAFDIDHFKRFNDTYGHLTGDQVLKLVGTVLQRSVKGQATACRMGGEEFVLILPDTPLRAAVAVAENVRRLIMGKELIRKSTNEVLGRVTVSIGVASLRRDDTVTSLYGRADQCLYAAKRTGRNKVAAEDDPEVESEVAAA